MKRIEFHEDFALEVSLEKHSSLYYLALDNIDKQADLCSRTQYFFSKEQLNEFVSYLKETADAIE
jgi:hypothetical protein